MAGITERNKQKNELAGMGYSLRYIDEWQPKTRLYRHKAAYNVDGVVMEGVGTFVDNVPGNPDYVLRKSRIGLFPWEPGQGCQCTWCKERGEHTFAPEATAVGGSLGPGKGSRNTAKVGPYFESSQV
jgi:hypothetical protein